jgi:polyisoprenoid-binding protein YceI
VRSAPITTATSIEIPGDVAGASAIDSIHLDVSFTVRHMMISEVRGRFSNRSHGPGLRGFVGRHRPGSIDTSKEQRDGHIRSADFFDTAKHLIMSYRSLHVRPNATGMWSRAN